MRLLESETSLNRITCVKLTNGIQQCYTPSGVPGFPAETTSPASATKKTVPGSLCLSGRQVGPSGGH